MNPRSIRRLAVHAVVGLLILMAVLVCVVIAILRRPIMYEIADGYKGWVVVRYDDPNCPALKDDALLVVIPVTSSGLGCTSNPRREGWQINLYEYVRQGNKTRSLADTGWGGGGEIWAGFDIPSKHSESFFVGTEQDLSQSWSRVPR